MTSDLPIEGRYGLPSRVWIMSAVAAVILHAAVAVVLVSGPTADQEPDAPPGAIMLELDALAAASPSDQAADSDELTPQTAAPPPSPTESADTPSDEPPGVQNAPANEPAPAAAKAPEPETPAEQPKEQPAEDAPPLAEAPLVPEPAVTLPKEAKAEEKPSPKLAPEKSEKFEPEKKKLGRAAQKSDSKQEQKAAASSKGSFNPNPIYRAKPAYPASARSSKIEGHVVVSYTVTPSGSVSNVRIISASPAGVFNAATIAAVSQWRFNPPGAAVSGRQTTVRFKLK